LFPTLGMAAAPVNSWAAQRAALPPDLRARRTTEWRRGRERRAFVRGAALGGVATVGAVVVGAIALLLTPGNKHLQPPQLVSPPKHAHSHAPHVKPSQSSSTTPSVSPSTSPTSTTPTPTPTTPSPTTPSPTVSPSVSVSP